VDSGQVDGAQSAVTGWNLSAVKADVRTGMRRVIATVTARQEDHADLSCKVEVYIRRREAPQPESPTQASPPGGATGAVTLDAAVADKVAEHRISTWNFLLPQGKELPGYGLYSYILFSAKPRDEEERSRYLKTIEAVLLVLQSADSYERLRVPRAGLNIIYIPVLKRPNLDESDAVIAQHVLDVYDYAQASVILNRVQGFHQSGPYLLSLTTPLAQPGTRPLLWQDLTGVVPDRAWDWVKNFAYLAAQPRTWSDAALQDFGLKLRNLIAVAGKLAPDVAKAMEKLIQVKEGLGR
jgi:hypothetical protein